MTTGYIDLPADVGGTVDLTTEVTGILPIANGGTGSATQNFVDLTTDQTVAGAKTFTGTPTAFTPTASTTAATTRFLFTGAADTTLTASTEAPNVYLNMSQTRQHSTGTLSTQRDFRISPSTHSFVGASTLTSAAAFSVDGPSNGGTNATITNSSAIYVPTSALTNVGNSYGINVAASSGATNNYAGIFTGGNLGIGSFTPTSLVHMSESNSVTGSSNGLTVEQAGTGDALVHFLLSGVQRYTMGIDNSDSDKFKIGTNADLGSSNLFTMTTSGNVGIGTTNPGYNLDVTGDIRASTNLRVGTGSARIATNGSDIILIDGGNNTSFRGARATSSWSDAVNSQWFQIGNSSDYVTLSTATGVPATRIKAQTSSFQVAPAAGTNVPTGLFEVSDNTKGLFNVLSSGNVGIGVTSPNANAILDVVSTTKASMPVPRMTTAQKGLVASPAAGMMVYDTTLNKLCVYTTAWETVTSI